MIKIIETYIEILKSDVFNITMTLVAIPILSTLIISMIKRMFSD